MDFAAEAIKNLAAALDQGATLVYVCPRGNIDRAKIEQAVKADKNWHPEFTLCERKDEVWAVLDPALLIDYADTLDKPMLGKVTEEEARIAATLDQAKVSEVLRDLDNDHGGAGIPPDMGVKNLPALLAKQDHLDTYEGPDKVLHPRPQEIGGIEYAGPAPEPEPLPVFDLTKTTDPLTKQLARLMADKGYCTIQ